MKRLFSLLAAGFLTLSVSGAIAAPENEKPAAAQQQVPSVERTAETVGPSLSGKVVETMNAGGYTYVLIEKNGKKTWIAVPEMEVSVGQQMAFQPGQEMKNFTSKTLNRTFKSVIFSGGPVPQKGTGDKTASVKAPGSKAAVVVSNEKISVEKAAGPDAYTVGEIYAKRASLEKKTVVVKGKVVKVSKGIMGKNWIHIQDGTGDSSKGTHDLVVTTVADTAAVGDTVTVKGIVYKDKDFGAGYKYDAIMEEATIQH